MVAAAQEVGVRPFHGLTQPRSIARRGSRGTRPIHPIGRASGWDVVGLGAQAFAWATFGMPRLFLIKCNRPTYRFADMPARQRSLICRRCILIPRDRGSWRLGRQQVGGGCGRRRGDWGGAGVLSMARSWRCGFPGGWPWNRRGANIDGRGTTREMSKFKI